MNADVTAPSPQAGFAAALLDAGQPLPAGLCAPAGGDVASRFAVYRNNVVASLTAALGETFPVARRWVGDAFFDALARAHVAAHPPASPVLAEYGEGFADWLDGFEPARAVPALADIARLEQARVRAFHADDAPALQPEQIAAHLADPGALPQARVRWHPSCQLLASRWAVATLWAAHQTEADPPPVAIDHPEAVLVLRDPADTVWVVPVAPEAVAFYRAWMAGQPLGAACAQAGDALDLAATWAPLIRHGALVAWLTAGDTA